MSQMNLLTCVQFDSYLNIKKIQDQIGKIRIVGLVSKDYQKE